VALGQSGSDRDRALRFIDGLRIDRLQLAGLGIFGGDGRQTARQRRVSKREVGVGRDRDLIVGLGLAIGRFVLGEVIERLALQIGLVRPDVASSTRSRGVGRHSDRECAGNGLGDFTLEGENVAQLALNLL